MPTNWGAYDDAIAETLKHADCVFYKQNVGAVLPTVFQPVKSTYHATISCTDRATVPFIAVYAPSGLRCDRNKSAIHIRLC